MRFLRHIKSFYNNNPAVILLLWAVVGISLSVYHIHRWILYLSLFVGVCCLILKIFEDKRISSNFSRISSRYNLFSNDIVCFFSASAIPLILSSLFAIYVNMRITERANRCPILNSEDISIVKDVNKRNDSYRLAVVCSDGIKRLLYAKSPEEISAGDSVSFCDIRNLNFNETYPSIRSQCVSLGIFDIVTARIKAIRKADRGSLGKQVFIRDFLLANIKKTELSDISKAMLSAMSLGEGDGDDIREMKNSFAMAGVAHTLVVSGFHLVLFMFMVSVLIDGFGLLGRNIFFRNILLIVFVWFFTYVTDMGIATLRAAIFATLYLIGKIIGRETHSVNVLATTAFLLLCYNPFFIMSASFVLSFSSVLSIILFYNRINSLLAKKIRFAFLRYVWNIVAVSLSVQPLVLPVVSYYFGYYSLGFLLLSLPITLLSSAIVICGWVVAVLGCFSIDIGFFLKLVDLLCLFTNNMVEVVSMSERLLLEIEISFSIFVVVYSIVVFVGMVVYNCNGNMGSNNINC